jgi:hypothetical protein
MIPATREGDAVAAARGWQAWTLSESRRLDDLDLRCARGPRRGRALFGDRRHSRAAGPKGIPASSSNGRQRGSLDSSRDAWGCCLANAHGAAVMWLMSDTEALAFIAIVALMLAVALVIA